MAKYVRCLYCAHWQKSPIHGIFKNNSKSKRITRRKKKKGKNQTTGKQYRLCNINNKRIEAETEACRYFKPRLYFYCHMSRYWLSIFQCLHRRSNRVFHLNKHNKPDYIYPDCTVKCYQFRDEILPICNKLKINRLGKLKKPKPKKIKRRPKQTHRTIKRRGKKATRSITRR